MVGASTLELDGGALSLVRGRPFYCDCALRFGFDRHAPCNAQRRRYACTASCLYAHALVVQERTADKRRPPCAIGGSVGAFRCDLDVARAEARVDVGGN